ncbi:MAG: FG-GAP-like repeat-containing protein [Candidatus Zhuqueibacterota bacterium]
MRSLHLPKLQLILLVVVLLSFASIVHAQSLFIEKKPFGPVDGSSKAIAWGDYNKDGFQDLYITNGEEQAKQVNFLFKNLGNGSFEKITTGAIVTDQFTSGGCAWGDFDNDNDLDLYVTTNTGNPFDLQRQNFLYENNGDESFTKNLTAGPPVTDAEFSATCAWGDYNNDGYIDLYVHNGWWAKQNNSLYQNNGNKTFTKITSADIVGAAGATFIGSSSWTDFDDDGDIDLAVAGGSGPNNFLWRNDGGAVFTKLDIFDEGDTQACSWGDYDNDGDMDLYFTNYGESESAPEANFLYQNNGDGTFTRNTTAGPIVTDLAFSTGSAWGDVDNDGDLDMFVGSVGDPTTASSYLYINNGDGTFSSNTTSGATDSTFVYGVAFADYNNDGFLDMVTSRYGANMLYENNSPNLGNTNHWITINCAGTVSNKAGIGAKVKVKATINSSVVWQLRDINTETGYASHNSLQAHFGLGNATTISEIKVEWPSGIIQTLTNVAVDQILTITEAAGGESIAVTSPNGGEDWQIGSSHDITWSSDETSGTVHIEYSTDNGSNWADVVASTTDDGSYTWTVPNAPSTLCLVRVTDTDSDPSDESDATFTISEVASITVTAPNGAEDWEVGTSQSITWTSESTSGTVHIEYSTDSGSNWADVTASTTDDGSFDWTIPNAPSANCLVKVSDTDGTPTDQSDAVFTISQTPFITVTAPNGAEDWEVGSSHAITWTSNKTSGNVHIEYSTDNGANWADVTASTTDDGSFDWTIPNAPSATCLVKVSDTDGTPADQSDAVFTISQIVYTLTMVANPVAGGTTAPTPGDHPYDAGTIVDINATANPGYEFQNWSGNVADANDDETTVTMNSNETVTANFTKVGVSITDLRASNMTENILLEWSAAEGITTYNVYRGTTFDFVPDVAAGTNRIAANITDEDAGTAGIQWTDTGNGANVVGDVATNYFYKVTAVSGEEFEPSNVAGEFDYQLVTTSGTDINRIVLIMNTADTRRSIATAENLAQAIPYCSDVYWWDASGQGTVGHVKGLPFNNFAVQPGYAYSVSVTKDTVWTVAGSYDNVSFNLVTTSGTDINRIGVPLAKAVLTTADQLGVNIPNCTDVYLWDAAGQGTLGHVVGLPFNNFAVRAGYPYSISITAPTTWPDYGEGELLASAPQVQGAGFRPDKSLAGGNIPHTVFGQIQHPDVEKLTLRAWISSRPGQVLTTGQVGVGIDKNYWYVGVSNFAANWNIGDSLIVTLTDEENGLYGSAVVVLSSDGSDDAGSIQLTGATRVAGVNLSELPKEFNLLQNYPNPFNPETKISYGLPQTAFVTVQIYDISGRLVRTLADENQGAGYHQVTWNGQDNFGRLVSSGVYFCKMKSGNFQKSMKLIFAK